MARVHVRLPPFTAGAHIDVTIPGGRTRQYSLCNHPAEIDRDLIAVLREPASRRGSAGMHGPVIGDELTIGLPHNLFPLAEAPTAR